ncbi:hypothetical protein DPSP01_009634 [Paraphaeosphaeria sporulosa]
MSKSRKTLAIELDNTRRSRQTALDNAEEDQTMTVKLEAGNCELQEENKQLKKETDTLTAKYEQLKRWHKEMNEDHQYASDRYSHIVEHLLRPYASSNNTRYDDHDRETIDATLQPLMNDAATSTSNRSLVEALDAKVLSLQQKLLCNVDKIDAVPDAMFATEFRQLAKAIKALSRQIQLKDPESLIRIDAVTQSLLVGRVKREDLNSAVCIRPIIEAFVWSILYSRLFCNPYKDFYMFGPIDLVNGFSVLFGEDHQHRWPSPTTSSEKWRVISMEQLVQRVGEEAIATGKIQGKCLQLEANIRRVRSKVKDIIEGYLIRVSPGTNFSRVDAIVDKAFSLALHIFLQCCRIQVVYPDIGDTYDKEQPHLDSIAESIEVEKGRVALIASPVLAKWGDGEGKHLDQRLDVVPAMVLAKPVAKEDDEKQVLMERLTSSKDEALVRIKTSTRKFIHPQVVIPSKPKSEDLFMKIEDTEMADGVQWAWPDAD